MQRGDSGGPNQQLRNHIEGGGDDLHSAFMAEAFQEPLIEGS